MRLMTFLEWMYFIYPAYLLDDLSCVIQLLSEGSLDAQRNVGTAHEDADRFKINLDNEEYS